MFTIIHYHREDPNTMYTNIQQLPEAERKFKELQLDTDTVSVYLKPNNEVTERDMRAISRTVNMDKSRPPSPFGPSPSSFYPHQRTYECSSLEEAIGTCKMLDKVDIDSTAEVVGEKFYIVVDTSYDRSIMYEDKTTKPS